MATLRTIRTRIKSTKNINQQKRSRRDSLASETKFWERRSDEEWRNSEVRLGSAKKLKI